MKKRFANIEDVNRYLSRLPKFSEVGTKAAHFSLKRIKAFLGELGDPHKSLITIHVAGTNGKGTTCHLLESVYRRAGFKTGLYTSPHLISVNERFRILGKPVTDDKLIAFFQQVDQLLDAYHLSYFELTTVMAFVLFEHEFVDVAIIETGLGGRLDATNVILPEISVITSISYDHTDVLGEDLSSIAWEKAGIIKKNRPVVVGNLVQEAMKVIEERAEKQNSKLIYASDLSPIFEKHSIHFQNTDQRFLTTFHEKINAWNVAMAYQVVRQLNESFTISDEDFKQAIEEFNGVPGRFEQIHPKFKWYFSGSHNLEGIQSTLQTVKAMKTKRKVVVLGMMKDKINKQIIDETLGFTDRYFYKLEGERAASIAGIPSHIYMKVMNEGDVEYMLSELKTSLVIFTGSFYFYPTVKKWMSQM